MRPCPSAASAASESFWLRTINDFSLPTHQTLSSARREARAFRRLRFAHLERHAIHHAKYQRRESVIVLRTLPHDAANHGLIVILHVAAERIHQQFLRNC